MKLTCKPSHTSTYKSGTALAAPRRYVPTAMAVFQIHSQWFVESCRFTPSRDVLGAPDRGDPIGLSKRPLEPENTVSTLPYKLDGVVLSRQKTIETWAVVWHDQPCWWNLYESARWTDGHSTHRASIASRRKKNCRHLTTFDMPIVKKGKSGHSLKHVTVRIRYMNVCCMQWMGLAANAMFFLDPRPNTFLTLQLAWGFSVALAVWMSFGVSGQSCLSSLL